MSGKIRAAFTAAVVIVGLGAASSTANAATSRTTQINNGRTYCYNHNINDGSCEYDRDYVSGGTRVIDYRYYTDNYHGCYMRVYVRMSDAHAYAHRGMGCFTVRRPPV